MRGFLWFLLMVALVPLLLGFGGRWHGLGDSLSVGRPAMIAVVAFVSVLCILGGVWRWGLIGIAMSVAALTTVLPPALGTAPEGARVYTVYQKNLLFRLPEIGPVAEEILQSGADFVMLQELHQRNRPILETLRATYPHQHFCSFAAVGGIAVLSKWPLKDEARCGDEGGMAAARVAAPDGPFWLVSLHLHWPYPHGQRAQVAGFLPVFAELEGPVVVGGDFNMVPWSYTVGAIAQATRTDLAGSVGGTFKLRHVPGGKKVAARLPRVPIDHVLLPESAVSVEMERRPLLGSDHHGVLVRFALSGND